MRVFLDGIEYTNFKPGSLRISDDINRRSRGRLKFYKDANFKVISGQKIEIKKDDLSANIFTGLIDRPRLVSLDGLNKVGIDCTLLDNQAICDRRVVLEAYSSQTVSYIVNDLFTKYLQAEGITLGTIEQGPIVNKAVFPYITLAQTFDDLTELSGFSWWITADKVLHFTQKGNFVAPWDITSTHQPIKNVEVETDMSKYRNRQYLRAGQDITDLQTENFIGDGKQRTFTVGYEIAQEPTVKINGTALLNSDVGIRGVEQGKKWYWSKGEKEISQASTATPLASTDTLTVEYKGLFPIVVVSEDAQAIQDRKTVEGGGTGLYESADQNATIDDSDVALEYAQGKLRKFAHVGRSVRFETFKEGLEAGQVFDIKMSEFDVDGNFLITQVEASELDAGKVIFNVQAIDGEDVGGWETFFKKMAEGNQKFVIRDNEVLVLLTSQSEKQLLKESMTFDEISCFPPSDTLYPSNTLYPC